VQYAFYSAIHSHTLMYVFSPYMINCCYSGIIMYLVYCIYSNKRCGAYKIFRASNAALIRGWHLFEGGAYLKIGCDKEIFFICTKILQ